MNKLFFIIFIACFLTISAAAQNFESGAFAAPVFKYTKLIDQSALVIGVRGGWIINKSIVLGAGYYALTSNIKTPYFDTQNNQTVMMNLNYGGLEFEYLFVRDTKFNLSVDMLFAGGGTEFYVRDNSKKYSNTNLLVWEPQINFEIELYSWLHADAGISYRMIWDNYDIYNVTKDDLRGMNVSLTFKIGKY